ncbi:jg10219 [Pararge aegeria aegeria]|uniref:Jg10219 protein n=1 Tax=Pararge aegeria aegeria TaxID=348720 RepID=A0A8S4SP04_9NEOP|nr:jg10219 [Pararge aegeria aegeria]
MSRILASKPPFVLPGLTPPPYPLLRTASHQHRPIAAEFEEPVETKYPNSESSTRSVRQKRRECSRCHHLQKKCYRLGLQLHDIKKLLSSNSFISGIRSSEYENKCWVSGI